MTAIFQKRPLPNFNTMKNIIPAAIAAISIAGLSGCISPTAAQKAQAAVAQLTPDANTLAADEQKAAALTGSASLVTTGTVPTKLANDLQYANSIAVQAQTLAPELQGTLSAIITAFTKQTASGMVWNARGIAACHRYHIDPRDRYAIAKLERILNKQRQPEPLTTETKIRDAHLIAQRPGVMTRSLSNRQLLSTPFYACDFSGVKAAQCRPLW